MSFLLDSKLVGVAQICNYDGIAVFLHCDSCFGLNLNQNFQALFFNDAKIIFA